MNQLSFLFPFVLISGLANAAIPPSDILKKADSVRNPSQSYQMKVQVVSGDRTSVFDVRISGNDKTLIKTLSPAKDKGRNLLMLEENMWAYIPNLKRAVRVGLNQKLSGQAANGDISRMRWSGDYEPTLESEDAKSWTLNLKATKKGLTYDRLKVVIEKNTFRPVSAEFQSLGGKVLKRASYGAYKPIAGEIRPTEIRIADAVRTEDVSLISIQSMQVKKFRSSIFHQRNLK